ncbi:hypothetical protein H6F74_24365 [Trichocoleus sp. FACHB-90]|uniref:hypothetical protein n=1 Tax=Cyanophyceae TaxID=3028117 RepID=UPI001683D786|nr:hypothetical protein [Trichocoleus sp. FACHB-90]MBD1929351.1 hypothetical protein [Trichocoleus sp. FACHB-90]
MIVQILRVYDCGSGGVWSRSHTSSMGRSSAPELLERFQLDVLLSVQCLKMTATL